MSDDDVINMDENETLGNTEIPGTRKRTHEGDEDSNAGRNMRKQSSVNWHKLVGKDTSVSELGGAAAFIIYTLENLRVDPEEYGVRALAVLVQHILKCAKTPQQFITTTKIQARYVNQKLVNPLLVSGFRDQFVQEYRSLVEKMPGNQKDLVRKIQYSCGHLSEVGNLHARQNDRMMSTIILPGIGAISGKFASAFISGGSRNTSAINVIKSMTVQGMVLYYYQLKSQGVTLKKDFKATQKSILETIQRRAGTNGAKLVQAIEQENSSDLLIGLNKTVPVLMAGHGLMIEDILSCWLHYRSGSPEGIQSYIEYTKASALNGVTMFNTTLETVKMTEANAYKYLFTKFALRGIGPDQFNKALKLNCIETDWSRMAINAMNYRSGYLLAGNETISNEVGMTETRKMLIKKIFDLLREADTLPTRLLQQCIGHLAYVWPFIGAPWYLLHDLYLCIETRIIPNETVRRARLAWLENLKTIDLRIFRALPEIFYTDATPERIGILHRDLMWSLPLAFPLPIFWAEMFAVIYAMYIAQRLGYTNVHLCCDNMPVIYVLRSLKGYTLPLVYMDALYQLKSMFTFCTISYVNTLFNPADLPNRLCLPSSMRLVAHAPKRLLG